MSAAFEWLKQHYSPGGMLRMARMAPVLLLMAITTSCTAIGERRQAAAVAMCGLEVGKTCKSKLMNMIQSIGGEPVSRACRVTDEGDFCVWCVGSGKVFVSERGREFDQSRCEQD